MSDSTNQVPAQILHVPQSSSSALNSSSVKSIMDAYNTQSKIQLYDEDSAQSQGAANENIGVTGRDIPLSMLRPSPANAALAGMDVEVDENGNRILRRNGRGARPSRGNILQEVESYGDIAKAYKAMNGIQEDMVVEEGEIATPHRAKDLSSVKRFHADYVEDMPDSDEGLLEILELAINNARANLEMLESLYAALSPGQSEEED